jgi:hypothetical protein
MLRKFFLLAILLFALALAVPVTVAQTGVTWNAEYFGNPYLLGDALKRQESAVNFDWGLASPANNIPSDGFSARFATDVYFDAGTYRFSVLADDRVRVSVAFQPVVDTFNNPQPGTLLSADVTLPVGVHHLQIDYSEDTFTAYLSFNWARLDGSGGPQLPVVNVSAPLINPNPWAAAYYANTSLADPPVYTQSVESPSRNFGSGAPNGTMSVDNFSVRWESVQPLQAGTYQIRVRADDGVRIYVNGGLVIDQWHSATGEIYTATATLPKGDHRFTVEYYEASGFAFVEYNLVLLGGTTIGSLYTLSGSAGSASAASNAPVPPPTGYNITAGDALNIRSGPDVSFERVGKMPYKAQAAILGRDSTTTWWQIDYNGIVGWVSARIGRIEPGANINSIPITG